VAVLLAITRNRENMTTNDTWFGALTVMTVITIAAVWYFNHEYRRVTGDRSYGYLSPNRWKLIALVLRSDVPQLSRLRIVVLVLLAVWLVLALIAVSLPLQP
jgi:surface polysaccharide O-acyltransferase-like enzyme